MSFYGRRLVYLAKRIWYFIISLFQKMLFYN